MALNKVILMQKTTLFYLVKAPQIPEINATKPTAGTPPRPLTHHRAELLNER